MATVHRIPDPHAGIADGRAEALVRLARQTLVEALGGEGAPAAQAAPGPRFEQVNISVWTGGKVRASMGGRGATLEDAVVAASRAAARDQRFGGQLQLAEVAGCRLDLWVQYASTTLTDVASLDLGLDGVELRQGRRYAYYKPSVPLTSRIRSAEFLLRRLAKKARLPDDAWQAPDADLRRTAWEHFAECGPGEVLRLRRLRPVHGALLTRAQVALSLSLAEDRLLAAQQENGLFLYHLHPFKPLPTGCQNLVRQAGCAFAVARSAACATDSGRAARLHAAAERAAGALLADGPAVGKLGALGLLLAALEHAGPHTVFGRERTQLRATVLAMQRPDGSFRCTSDSPSLEADGVAQNFYPGEALVALALALPEVPDLVYPALRLAFAFYRSWFHRQPATAFVLWQVEAWRLVAHWPGHDIDAAGFVFEMVDWLLKLQIDAAAELDRDFIGGFSRAGRRPDFSSSLYTEATLRACALADRLGLQLRAARYREAGRRGLAFVLRLQIPPQTAALFAQPQLVVGGTTRSLGDLLLRCDFDQHAITAYLAALACDIFCHPATDRGPTRLE